MLDSDWSMVTNQLLMYFYVTYFCSFHHLYCWPRKLVVDDYDIPDEASGSYYFTRIHVGVEPRVTTYKSSRKTIPIALWP